MLLVILRRLDDAMLRQYLLICKIAFRKLLDAIARCNCNCSFSSVNQILISLVSVTGILSSYINTRGNYPQGNSILEYFLIFRVSIFSLNYDHDWIEVFVFFF